MWDKRILTQVAEAIGEETGEPDVAIGPQTTADDVPGWDSLAHTRIVMNLNLRLGTAIDVKDTYAAANVGELVAIVSAALG